MLNTQSNGFLETNGHLPKSPTPQEKANRRFQLEQELHGRSPQVPSATTPAILAELFILSCASEAEEIARIRTKNIKEDAWKKKWKEEESMKKKGETPEEEVARIMDFHKRMDMEMDR